MSCPPGTVLNPRSLRCVRASGRVARNLVRRGNIGELDIGYAAPAAWPQEPKRRTVRAPRMGRLNGYAAPAAGAGSLAAAFGVGSGRGAGAIPALGALFGYGGPEPAPKTEPVHHRGPAVPALTGAKPCPPGTTRNPATQRCIKLSGRTYKKLVAPPAPLVVSPPAGDELVIPRIIPRMRTTRRATRIASEPSSTLPVGAAAAGPIGDRTTVLEWAGLNCENTRDPLTRTMFISAPLDHLQGMVRTHDGQCTFAPALHNHVYTAHHAGKAAALPASPSTPMTLDDFKALRNTMRRQNPAYKIPARRRQPLPSSWQLYITSDRRSGPDFISVMYVDSTKGRSTPYGIEYPPEAVRADLGFIPVSVSAGSLCSARTVSELIVQLANMNKLLTPVTGGWKPVAGFPFKKSYWDDDRAAKMSRLCQDLAKVLASPI